MPETRNGPSETAARQLPAARSTLRARMLWVLALAGLPGIAVAVYLTVAKLQDETAQIETSAQRLAQVAATEQGKVVRNARTLLTAVTEFQSPASSQEIDCRSYLTGWTEELGYASSLTLYDDAGVTLCGRDDGVLPDVAANRTWFETALTGGGPALSDYTLGNDGQPLLIAAHPIAYADEARGVVALAISLEWLSLLAANANLPAEATITTLGPEGAVLSHWGPGGTDDGDPVQPAEATLARIAESGGGVLRAPDAGGVTRIYGVAETGDGELTLAVGLPQFVQYAQWSQAVFGTLMAPLAVLALALLAAAWASEALVVRHVRSLIGTAGKIAEGRYDVRTDVSYDEHELGQLAAAIDSMAESIGESHDELSERNEIDRTIAREMQHRIGNTLALAQAIAKQTMRHSASREEFVETYGKRLNALAISNRMLIDNDWVSTDLRGLLRNVMRPHLDGDGDRLSLEGPDVDVDSRTCLALALTVHELATNATKYGALGHPQGRLRIAWAVETGTAKAGGPERALRLTWSETGAGKAQLPDSEGFGSQLMTMMIERSLFGTIEQAETEEGLATVIRFPLPKAELAPAAEPRASA